MCCFEWAAAARTDASRAFHMRRRRQRPSPDRLVPQPIEAAHTLRSAAPGGRKLRKRLPLGKVHPPAVATAVAVEQIVERRLVLRAAGARERGRRWRCVVVRGGWWERAGEGGGGGALQAGCAVRCVALRFTWCWSSCPILQERAVLWFTWF